MPGLSERILELLNKQLNAELYSAYLYLSMAAYFEEKSLKGFASWMKKQAREELEHAMKIFNYIVERGGRVSLEAIEKPLSEWESPLEAVRYALEHETKVTKSIDELFKAAREEGDHATEVFLHWFIREQVEEESQFSDLLAKLNMAGDDPAALIALDSALSKR
ncbi:MAG: ferritin [Desulfurococcales archaeon]|nr:ferritin [Desulfurococcales archaeon]